MFQPTTIHELSIEFVGFVTTSIILTVPMMCSYPVLEINVWSDLFNGLLKTSYRSFWSNEMKFRWRNGVKLCDNMLLHIWSLVSIDRNN